MYVLMNRHNESLDVMRFNSNPFDITKCILLHVIMCELDI